MVIRMITMIIITEKAGLYWICPALDFTYYPLQNVTEFRNYWITEFWNFSISEFRYFRFKPPPQVVYSTDLSKAVVPVLVLLFVALWFILRGDLFYVLPCVVLLLCFSVLLALRLPRLGKRELVWICRFPLPLGVSEGLRFVIVTLPRLFSYLFLSCPIFRNSEISKFGNTKIPKFSNSVIPKFRNIL